MNIVKYIPFYRRWRTRQHEGWWKNRKINWQEHYTSTWNIPRRQMFIAFLKSFRWGISMYEIGMGGGANLVAMAQTLNDKEKGLRLGGCDINPDAVNHVKHIFQNNGVFSCCPADDVMMSDNSTDLTIADMMYIYVNGKDIDRHMKEVYRITRNYVVFHEFYSPSWWERLKLKARSGYTAHDWKKVLERNGFYDIMIYKVPEEMCGGEPQKQFSHIIKARVPQRK